MQTGKRKRTTEMDDFYDLGDGYDSDDPFIDNTEAVRFLFFIYKILLT